MMVHYFSALLPPLCLISSAIFSDAKRHVNFNPVPFNFMYTCHTRISAADLHSFLQVFWEVPVLLADLWPKNNARYCHCVVI